MTVAAARKAGNRRSPGTTGANGQWDKAREAVETSAADLRTMKTHAEIFGWAKEHNLSTRLLWPKVKVELRKQLGIDYEELRTATRKARVAELAAAAAEGPLVLLCAAGDAEVDAFAVTRADGSDPWYGDFYERDGVTDQTGADLAAASKAIYLAGQAREAADLDVVELRLTVSNHHVAAEDLWAAAIKARVHLALELTDGANPALEQCREPGYRSWREITLTELISERERDGDR